MTYYGRDYASYQGELVPGDCQGIQFAYVKATEGATYVNPDAPQQCAMLRSQGVLVGYYHFLDMGVSVGDQIDNFNKAAQALGDTSLPLALDSETADPAGWQDLAYQMMQFVTGVEAWTYPVPNPNSLLYVNLDFYENLPGFPWGRWVWLADPGVAAPSKPCLVWQVGPQAAPSGNVIDYDIFMGTEADWAQFTNNNLPAATPGKDTEEMRIVCSAPGGGQALLSGNKFMLLPTEAAAGVCPAPVWNVDLETWQALQTAYTG